MSARPTAGGEQAGTLGLVGALGVNLLLGAALLQAPPAPVVHPLAPPLTRISALGDRPIGGEGPPPDQSWRVALDRTLAAVGTPAQRAEAAAVLRPPPPPPPGEGRARLQSDAVAIAAVLGPERVGLCLARRESLGDWYGEGRVWDEIGR